MKIKMTPQIEDAIAAAARQYDDAMLGRSATGLVTLSLKRGFLAYNFSLSTGVWTIDSVSTAGRPDFFEPNHSQYSGYVVSVRTALLLHRIRAGIKN